jgi:hypothetical protein
VLKLSKAQSLNVSNGSHFSFYEKPHVARSLASEVLFGGRQG